MCARKRLALSFPPPCSRATRLANVAGRSDVNGSPQSGHLSPSRRRRKALFALLTAWFMLCELCIVYWSAARTRARRLCSRFLTGAATRVARPSTTAAIARAVGKLRVVSRATTPGARSLGVTLARGTRHRVRLRLLLLHVSVLSYRPARTRFHAVTDHVLRGLYSRPHLRSNETVVSHPKTSSK
jgi:hypothetical protein